MLLSLLVILAFVYGVGITTARRMFLGRTTQWLVWVTLVPAVALATLSAYVTLYPGPTSSHVELNGEKGTVGTLQIPPNHVLLTTATLTSLDTKEALSPAIRDTTYGLGLRGDGWDQNLEGLIKRKLPKSSTNANLPMNPDGSISNHRTSNALGGWRYNDTQDRFHVKGSGEVQVTLSEWAGKACTSILVEAIPAPVPQWIYIVGGLVLCVLGVVCDVKYRTDRLGSDIGFLAFSAPFIDYGIVPLGGITNTLFWTVGAMAVGGLAVGGVSTIAMKLMGVEDPNAKKKKPIKKPTGEGQASKKV